MQSRLLPILLILLIVLVIPSSFPNAQSYTVESQKTNLHLYDNPIVQVWFDALPQLSSSNPTAYLFNLEAKTSSGSWITNLHWDFGDGVTLDSPFSGQNQVSEIRAHIYATKSNYCVTVTATDNLGNTGTATVSLRPDFTLNTSPNLQNTPPGGAVTYNITVGLFCGRQAFVKLTTSLNQNVSAGLTWNLNPDSSNTPFSSILNVQTAPTTPPGTYTFNIIGTGAGNVHSATVTLIVAVPPQPDFSISATPTSLNVSAQAQPTAINVTIQSINGFNNPVTLNLTGTPFTVTSFSINPVTPPPNGVSISQFKISADCSVNSGTYTIQVTGASGSAVRQTTIKVNVSGCTFPIWLAVGIISLLLTLPFIFLMFRRRRRSPAAILIPAAGYCMTCGKPMVFYEAYRRWYCNNCQKFI